MKDKEFSDFQLEESLELIPGRTSEKGEKIYRDEACNKQTRVRRLLLMMKRYGKRQLKNDEADVSYLCPHYSPYFPLFAYL